jgi:hypothetical protein
LQLLAVDGFDGPVRVRQRGWGAPIFPDTGLSRVYVIPGRQGSGEEAEAVLLGSGHNVIDGHFVPFVLI